MRVMDLYTSHMKACDDPPRPSVAAESTPSVATKVLIALLFVLQMSLARAEPNHLSPSQALELSYLSFHWLVVSIICLSFWVCCEFKLARSSFSWTPRNVWPTGMVKLLLVISCLYRPCLATSNENPQTASEH